MREVWKRKFKGRGSGGKQSNVDLAVLDSEGNLIHWFDAFRRIGPRRLPGGGQKRESLGDYTVRGLKQAIPALDLDHAPTAEHPLKLPDLEGPGIRIFVRLLEERMRAYRAPVVEVVALNQEDWKPLHYPRKKRRIEASALKKWLSQVYPPGVMERTHPQTKVVYAIKSTDGDLNLTPIPAKAGKRQAILRGVVRLTDEGPGDFSFQGIIEAVITFKQGEDTPQTLRGYFDGLYPRNDRMHREIRWLPLQAALESIPE